MCGLFGMLFNKGYNKNEIFINKIKHFLNHRGPDGSGCVVWNEGSTFVKKIDKKLNNLDNFKILLWHTRLSILDLSDNGSQPMVSEDGRFALAYNGEIYNFLEIKQKLIKLNYNFNSESDTEVLIKAWQHWGQNCLKFFNGMFAFSLIDLRLKKFYLVRDIFGIKPLYWAENEKGIFFSSEISPLLEICNDFRKPNLNTIFQFLKFGYTDRFNSTFFSEINRISPGQLYEFDLDILEKRRIHKYWNLDVDKENLSLTSASSKMKELFFTSVKQHLRSDVPLALTLSGGIDSSSILSSIIHLGYKDNIEIFSYINKTKSQSEEVWIDYLAKHFNLKLNKIFIESLDFVKAARTVVKAQEEPFATTGIFAQHEVYKKIHENNIKVNLDGQGADEIFAGYPTFLSVRFISSIKSGDFSKLKWIFNENPKFFMRVIGMLLPSKISIFLQDLFKMNNFSNITDSIWFENRGVLGYEKFNKKQKNTLHDKLIDSIFDLSLPSLLRYLDKNSMYHSVESRVPFLSKDILEFVFSLPESYLIDDKKNSKSVLRIAMENIVPEKILSRKDKIGFAVPETEWMNYSSEWIKKMKDLTFNVLPMVQHENLLTEFNKLANNKKLTNNQLWRHINLSIWAEEFNIKF